MTVEINPELLIPALQSAATPWRVRVAIPTYLSDVAPLEPHIVVAVATAMRDDLDNDVRKACARALAKIGRSSLPNRGTVIQILVHAVSAPEYEIQDRIEERTGQDYAFDALWMLVTGNETSSTS